MFLFVLKLRDFDPGIVGHPFRGVNVHLGGVSLSSKFLLLNYPATHDFRHVYETIGILSSPRFAMEINNNDIIYLFHENDINMLLFYYLYQ